MKGHIADIRRAFLFADGETRAPVLPPANVEQVRLSQSDLIIERFDGLFRV